LFPCPAVPAPPVPTAVAAAGPAPATEQYIVRTLAGGRRGSAVGTGRDALFNNPIGIVVASDNSIFVTDERNDRICIISPAGEVRALVIDPRLAPLRPAGIALTHDRIYVTSSLRYKDRIKVFDLQGRLLSTIGDERGFNDATGTDARFDTPKGLACMHDGSILVADSGNSCIRSISPESAVQSLTGTALHYRTLGHNDGPIGMGLFNNPCGIVEDNQRNIYIADTGNNCIRMITGGIVRTIAGSPDRRGFRDGIGSVSLFNRPEGIAFDPNNNIIYVADTGNNCIRMINPEGLVQTIAGHSHTEGNVDGPGITAKFNSPKGIAVGSNGIIYVTDTENNCIRTITIL
jgi:DNA-binding beta-propeller fold protein YncE